MTPISRLLILHTNDIHSHFENMPKLASRITRFRQLWRPDELVLIDCGDHLDRMRIETEGSVGLANIAVMNEMGYDIFVPGNNEGLTFSKPMFESAFREHARFHVLGTNMTERGTGHVPPWMYSRIIIDRYDIRIGVLGVTACFNDFYHPLGWDITDPFQTVAEDVAALRDQVNLLIVVSHVGIAFDRRLAEEIDGIDCILGGHTHHLLLQAEYRSGTLIGAAGKSGTHLGVIEVRFDPETHRILDISGHAEEMAEEEAEPHIAEIIEQFRASSLVAMMRQVACLEQSIPHHNEADSQLGNLLADGLRRWTRSEIGIVNSGQMLQGFSDGAITGADLLTACPSPINPCLVLVYGRDLLQALEQSLLDEYQGKGIRGFGFRGNTLGGLCVSGMEIIYNNLRPDYDKIESVTIGSEPLDPERQYEVGTIDMFTFGVGYPTLGAGQVIRYFLPEFIRDVLQRELTDPAAIMECRSHRWRLADQNILE